MTIQFVDIRISNQAASDTMFPVVIPLAATPFVFGDIIQTAGVLPANQVNVRELLAGYVKTEKNPQFNTNTINVRRKRDYHCLQQLLALLSVEKMNFSVFLLLTNPAEIGSQ